MDGTQDVQGKEQVSICLRYVDKELEPHEVFVGLYEVPGTTGEQMAKLVVDVLLRLNLPISRLRGQTYDGAANMAGKFNGAQAVLKKEQPLALYVHCGAHCVNLITQCACSASPLVRDALQWVHDLGTLSNQSGKFKGVLAGHGIGEGHIKSVKPLCPTRWTVRGQTVDTVLSQYEAILTSLEEMALAVSDSGPRANGLLERFLKGKTVLGLLVASEVLGELECLNRSLQKQSETVRGMQAAGAYVTSILQEKISDEKFQELFEKAEAMVEKLGLEPVQIPQQRAPPKRFTGKASHHQAKTPEEYYRVEFFKLLDCLDLQFSERFNQPDLEKLRKIENILLSGILDDAIEPYFEIDREILKTQLPMFRSKCPVSTTREAVEVLRAMPREVRGLFDEVEKLIRILIVVPVSSAEAERSFSALKRLKTWLRSTMSQQRLNNVSVCHVHQATLDKIELKDVGQQFISVNDRRRYLFGVFK
ncbi:zinc finger MYM-type protein 1-like [Anarrhichthys ocellatus]|uniref:zinc finger MYM-type protein 1-like n=1 Tax=Anarrhichthys ocellatus TaxID=433405 RepID=UPI0012EDEC84|nr:zinc finger MYM-type protein 1-like [Anarrhichthys ocellatus]